MAVNTILREGCSFENWGCLAGASAVACHSGSPPCLFAGKEKGAPEMEVPGAVPRS